ncbi:sensor histidine kinase [Pedobacter borealis]|uniref:sensor histidine kinase n=1 Tax=Pedobacter borealis TaxID=475254 RepID=UPI00049386DC|nr:HAMP domain-containing sensor histidine kinase [Pedobacter borealis]
MKKRMRFVWLLAIVTITGIIVFQVYWVYNSYKTEERNFYSSVTFSLERSISAYMSKEIKPQIIFKADSSSLSEISGIVRMPRENNSSPESYVGGQGIVVKFPASQKNSQNVSQMKLGDITLMAQNFGKPLKIKMLSSFLQQELKKDNMAISFNLVLLKKQKMLPVNKAAVFVSFSKDSEVVVANITNESQYLLLRILVPALISLLLIFLSAASLYYMGIIIRRQMKLDSMKNDFFSNIAHELRTPISILKSTHEALYKFGESSDPEITSRYLEINTAILDKLDSNVDRILDITRYEHGVKPVNIERVDLLLLINKIIAEFSVHDHISIQYNLPLNAYVNTDMYIIHTVLTNLVDNAIKYTEGQVKINIIAALTDHHWKLEVKDNGQGIDEEYLPYIFDKFYRVPSGNIHDVKGYGLGLNYVKELVAALNGKIDVKSSKGIGTTFILKFPIYG